MMMRLDLFEQADVGAVDILADRMALLQDSPPFRPSSVAHSDMVLADVIEPSITASHVTIPQGLPLSSGAGRPSNGLLFTSGDAGDDNNPAKTNEILASRFKVLDSSDEEGNNEADDESR